jgi:hypothetical protein
VPDNPWDISSYKDYVSAFDKDPTQFYPSEIANLEETKRKKLSALIVASATPPAPVQDGSTPITEDMGVGDSTQYAEWPKVADAVIEAKLSTSGLSMSLLARMTIGPAGVRDGDRVWTRKNVAEYVVFGPYLTLLPGRYRLTVVMETDPALLDAHLVVSAMAIEVICGRYIAARCNLAAEDLRSSTHTLLFTVLDDFKDYFNTQNFEFRIWTCGVAHAAITSITLDPADDEHAPDTSDFDWLSLLQVGPAGARADLSRLWVSAQPGKVGHVVFGPYVDLLPGSYRLCFELAADCDSPLPIPTSPVAINVGQSHQKLFRRLIPVRDFSLSGFKRGSAREAVAPLEIEVVAHDVFLTKVPIMLHRGAHAYEVSFSVSAEDFQRLPKGELEFRVQSSGTVPWELRALRLRRWRRQ